MDINQRLTDAELMRAYKKAVKKERDHYVNGYASLAREEAEKLVAIGREIVRRFSR